MMHLASMVSSRSLNGRTRTATLTDAIVEFFRVVLVCKLLLKYYFNGLFSVCHLKYTRVVKRK